MSSIFDIIHIASTALKTHKEVVSVVGHSIANAQTPGYSRQEALRTAILGSHGGVRIAQEIPLGEKGGGVQVMQIVNHRSQVLDSLYRRELQSHKMNQNLTDFLLEVQGFFNEPSDEGLGGIINEFWNTFLDLSNDPENMAARETVKQQATKLTNMFHRLDRSFHDMVEKIDEQVARTPDVINGMTKEIARINEVLRIQGGNRSTANDLMDRRELLIDELAEYGDTMINYHRDNSVTVVFGDNVVVEKEAQFKMSAVGNISQETHLRRTILQDHVGTEYDIERGKLGAMINIRDVELPRLISTFDDIAAALVELVNSAHSGGYGLDGSTGDDFFDPNKTNASIISLSEVIKGDIRRIAASFDGNPGDNQIALAISELRSAKILEGGKYTLADYYNRTITEIGAKTKEAISGMENQKFLVDQLENSRQSIQGVSIDEELITLIESQHIYQASARLISVVDEMLDDLINIKR